MRDEVVAAARQTLRLDLNAGTSGNVSARLPDGRVVVTPSALPYDEMTPDDLVVVELDGTVVTGRHRPTGELALHLACYRALPGVAAVVHTHPVHATMFACLELPVPALVDEFALYAGGDVRCARYAPSGSERLGTNAVAALGPAGSALLAYHGMVTVGPDLAAAVHQAMVVERGARIVWGARLMGTALGMSVPDDRPAESDPSVEYGGVTPERDATAGSPAELDQQPDAERGPEP